MYNEPVGKKSDLSTRSLKEKSHSLIYKIMRETPLREKSEITLLVFHIIDCYVHRKNVFAAIIFGRCATFLVLKGVRVACIFSRMMITIMVVMV